MGKAGMVVAVAEERRRRKRWPKELKQRIVEETLLPSASVAAVARANDVNANQVHTWRRLYERGLLNSGGACTALLPVRVVNENERLAMARISSSPAEPHSAQRLRRSRPNGVIQIEVERGRLRVEGAADPTSLRVVLECLLGWGTVRIQR